MGVAHFGNLHVRACNKKQEFAHVSYCAERALCAQSHEFTNAGEYPLGLRALARVSGFIILDNYIDDV